MQTKRRSSVTWNDFDRLLVAWSNSPIWRRKCGQFLVLSLIHVSAMSLLRELLPGVPAHLAAVGDGSWVNATPSRLGLPDWRTREGASFPITQYNQTDSLNFPSISFVSQHHLFFCCQFGLAQPCLSQSSRRLAGLAKAVAYLVFISVIIITTAATAFPSSHWHCRTSRRRRFSLLVSPTQNIYWLPDRDLQ